MNGTQPFSRRAALALAGAAGLAPSAVAQTGALRAAYLTTNPAQAVREVRTGELRGAAADLAREIARRRGAAVSFVGLRGAADIAAAVRRGEADIGFTAPEPERPGVAFTKPYMLVMQSFLVTVASGITSVAELDRPGRLIGAVGGEPATLHIKGWAKQASLRESADATLQEAARWLKDGVVDAFGGARHRLGAAQRGAPGLRLLPDNLAGVPQAIAVAADRPEMLGALNGLIDELRASGFLKTAIERGGVDGLAVAP